MEPGEYLGGSRKDEMKALEIVAGVRGQTRAAGDNRSRLRHTVQQSLWETVFRVVLEYDCFAEQPA